VKPQKNYALLTQSVAPVFIASKKNKNFIFFPFGEENKLLFS
jgi:hypothetical protein